jgi:deoxyadenosine/deoxycytidine kinase
MLNISIVGNIGCGKTTLLQQLAEKGYGVAYEQINEWKFLDKFYEDMHRWSFTLQVEILNSFKTIDILNKIVERSPWEACHIFAKNSFDNGFMSVEEYEIICDITKNVGHVPDVFIYIKASPQLCMERIKLRNRDCEKYISFAYIEQLYKLYEKNIENLLVNSRYIKIVDANMKPCDIRDEVISFISKLPENNK